VPKALALLAAFAPCARATGFDAAPLKLCPATTLLRQSSHSAFVAFDSRWKMQLAQSHYFSWRKLIVQIKNNTPSLLLK
jgi:hypothetical protein